MELNESRVYEALGVRPEGAAGGGNGQEDAGSAAQTVPEGAGAETDGGDEVSAGGQEAPEPEGEGLEGGGGAKGAEEPEGPPEAQDLEERRKDAADRRRAEQQAAIDEAVRKALQEERGRAEEKMADFFKKAQLKNTFTGEDITTMEEFDTWEKAYSGARLQRELQEGKLTPEGLERAISENPMVRQAQELLRKQEETARAAEAAAAQARVEAELLEIQKLDPEVKSVEDLLHMPTARAFYELVQRGNSFLDAFRLANYDRLTARAAEAARQQAQNLSRSKEHLKATAQRGGGAVSVPPEELRLFREMNPGASEAEIQAYYNKYQAR